MRRRGLLGQDPPPSGWDGLPGPAGDVATGLLASQGARTLGSALGEPLGSLSDKALCMSPPPRAAQSFPAAWRVWGDLRSLFYESDKCQPAGFTRVGVTTAPPPDPQFPAWMMTATVPTVTSAEFTRWAPRFLNTSSSLLNIRDGLTRRGFRLATVHFPGEEMRPGQGSDSCKVTQLGSGRPGGGGGCPAPGFFSQLLFLPRAGAQLLRFTRWPEHRAWHEGSLVKG